MTTSANAEAALPTEILAKAATTARGLAIDAVVASQSGHLGLPLGCADIGAVLFGTQLSYDPTHPEWLNRDRFVLSAGHGSMFLYAWLHLAGYADMTLEEVKRFRQMDSKTPGHPELTHAPSGVETTTGPLGQGIANGVGMAVSQKMAAARFNTKEHTIFDHKIVVLAGDGCMQEGVAMEALEFCGHQKLDNFILFYDSNNVTLDAMAKETQSENTGERLDAMGFDVQTIDGHDMQPIRDAFVRAKKAGSGKPQAIICKTLIGKGIPEVEGTQKAHGEGGAKFADAARKALGLPEEKFFVAEAVKTYFKGHRESWRRATPRGARRSTRGRPPTRSSPRSSGSARASAFAAKDKPKEVGPGEAVRGDPRVRQGLEDRDPQGRAGRAPAARQAAAAGRRRKRRSLRLDPQLHRRPEGGRRRLQAGAPRRAQHPLRHPRARHVLDHERDRRLRHLPAERRDLPRVRRLLPRGHPPGGAQPPARRLHLHPRQRGRGRGRPDARARRDDPRPARHPQPRRHPPGRPGGDGGRVSSAPSPARTGRPCWR